MVDNDNIQAELREYELQQRAGHPKAFALARSLCNRTGTPEPEWVNKAAGEWPEVANKIRREKNAPGMLGWWEKQFNAGDCKALFLAIDFCASCGAAIPDWAAMALRRSVERVISGEVRSWDEAFGKPYKKGSHISSQKRNEKAKGRVFERIKEIRARENVAICPDLFERVGKELGIGGKSTVEKLSYQAVAEDRDFWQAVEGSHPK